MARTGIDIATLNKFLKHKFSGLLPELMHEGYGDFKSNETDILYEMANYGLEQIEDLDNIIPPDYADVISNLKIKLNYLGTLRVLLIIHDCEKYIRNYNDFSYRNFWEISNIKSIESIFSNYGISVDEIIKRTRENEKPT